MEHFASARLNARTSTYRALSLLIPAVVMDWDILTSTLLCCTVVQGNDSCWWRLWDLKIKFYW